MQDATTATPATLRHLNAKRRSEQVSLNPLVDHVSCAFRARCWYSGATQVLLRRENGIGSAWEWLWWRSSDLVPTTGMETVRQQHYLLGQIKRQGRSPSVCRWQRLVLVLRTLLLILRVGALRRWSMNSQVHHYQSDRPGVAVTSASKAWAVRHGCSESMLNPAPRSQPQLRL